MGKNNTHLKRRFFIFSIALFILIFTASGAVFIISMQNIIKKNKTTELMQMMELQRLKLESAINSEIAVALKLADSPIIKRYFADPSDSEVEKYALEEIAGYRRAFSSFSIFWVNDIDKIFYSNDNDPYVVNPDDPDSYWYNMTLYETGLYNFNINYNPGIHMAKLWINAPVFDDTHKSLGMVGTGIELTKYIDMIYQGVDERIELYLINAAGEVTGSKDVEAVVAKNQIGDTLSEVNIDILEEALSLQPGETRTYDTFFGKLAIGTIPVLGWYTVAISPVGISDYEPSMVALFFLMLTIIAIILIIFNIFIAEFLNSLQKTMASLEVASKSKSEFLDAMSHEIRTSLNAIIGNAQICLQKDDLPKKYAEEMENIHSSGNNLLGIINDIFDLSKIENGELELNDAEYDVADLINDAVSPNLVRIGSKPVEFALDIDKDMPRKLCGDELRLKQILNNLLSNAIKHTREGQVKLSVFHRLQGEEALVRFVVRDSGQGMKPEDLKMLLSEHTRFNAGVTRPEEGAGLRLSIINQLVKLMDGTIEVQSEYGKGSVFTVTLKQKSVPCEPIGAEIAQKLSSFTL